MRTIFITLAEPAVARNIFRTPLLSDLMSDQNLRLVIVTDQAMVEPYQKEFGTDRILVEGVHTASVSLSEKILAFFARNGFATGTNNIMQHRAYSEGEARIPAWVKRSLGIFLNMLPGFQSGIRWLDLHTTINHPSVSALFNTYKPDMVFSTVLRNTPIDLPILREARRRGVKTVGMVRGWDNLTTYGFLRFIPDTYFAQIDFLKNMAIRYHRMRADHIQVVGTTYFDVYKNNDLYVSREEFCKGMGIDPSKKIILYAAIGDFLFPKEGEIADVFEEYIEDGEIPKDAIVIFRAHPAFESPLERMRGMKHVIPNRMADYNEGSLARWDMKLASTAHLVNSILHASVVVTAGSTMMIESALMGKPTITVAFDGNTKERYWFSIARFHEIATHIVALLKVEGVRVAWSKKELASLLSGYIQDPQRDEEKRKQLVEQFVGPNHGHSAEYLAKALLAELP